MLTLNDYTKWLHRATRLDPKLRIAIHMVSKAMGEVECWVTDYSVNTSGYAEIWVGGKLQLLHRTVWELEFGPIPEGKCVLHKCDNPKCCNPDHLFVGTRKDNALDKVSKGRQSHCGPRLVEEQVREIKHRLENGAKQKDLALAYGVTPTAISHISTGKTWENVGPVARGEAITFDTDRGRDISVERSI